MNKLIVELDYRQGHRNIFIRVAVDRDDPDKLSSEGDELLEELKQSKRLLKSNQLRLSVSLG